MSDRHDGAIVFPALKRNGTALAVIIWTVIVFVVAQQFAGGMTGGVGGPNKQCLNTISELTQSSATLAATIADTQAALQTCRANSNAAAAAVAAPAQSRERESKSAAVPESRAPARRAAVAGSDVDVLPAKSDASGDRSIPVFRAGQRGYCTADAECANGGRCDKHSHGCICASSKLYAGPYCQEEVPTVSLDAFRTRSDPYKLPGIALRTAEQQQFFKAQCGSIRPILDSLPRQRRDVPAGSPFQYYYENSFFTDCDAAFYMCMINFYRPKRILEVGCGFSTTIAAYTINKLRLDTQLTAIDPMPRIPVEQMGIKTLVMKVQSVPLQPFMDLEANDILFIDSSHRFEPGSDVHLLFSDVLPRLAPGVVVHIHDVYFPSECRTNYAHTGDDEWQYLETFLSFNKGFEIIASTTYFDCNPQARDVLNQTIGRTCWTPGSNLWIRRTAYHH